MEAFAATRRALRLSTDRSLRGYEAWSKTCSASGLRSYFLVNVLLQPKRIDLKNEYASLVYKHIHHPQQMSQPESYRPLLPLEQRRDTVVRLN